MGTCVKYKATLLTAVSCTVYVHQYIPFINSYGAAYRVKCLRNRDLGGFLLMRILTYAILGIFCALTNLLTTLKPFRQTVNCRSSTFKLIQNCIHTTFQSPEKKSVVRRYFLSYFVHDIVSQRSLRQIPLTCLLLHLDFDLASKRLFG